LYVRSVWLLLRDVRLYGRDRGAGVRVGHVAAEYPGVHTDFAGADVGRSGAGLAESRDDVLLAFAVGDRAFDVRNGVCDACNRAGTIGNGVCAIGLLACTVGDEGCTVGDRGCTVGEWPIRLLARPGDHPTGSGGAVSLPKCHPSLV